MCKNLTETINNIYESKKIFIRMCLILEVCRPDQVLFFNFRIGDCYGIRQNDDDLP